MKLVVNDVERAITSHPLTPLLQVLREELGLTLPRPAASRAAAAPARCWSTASRAAPA